MHEGVGGVPLQGLVAVDVIVGTHVGVRVPGSVGVSVSGVLVNPGGVTVKVKVKTGLVKTGLVEVEVGVGVRVGGRSSGTCGSLTHKSGSSLGGAPHKAAQVLSTANT